MLIRNDDVAADTTLHEIQTFCEICDRYGVGIIHAVTPIGKVRPVQVSMGNAAIRQVSGVALFSENQEVVNYLRRRNDELAVHGLWHTHRPSYGEITAGAKLIDALDFPNRVSAFVPPFNEWEASDERPLALRVIGAGFPRLEEFLEAGEPAHELVYLHSWRFEHGPFSWKQLDSCLKRLTQR